VQLDRTRVLVTGASRGIGQHLARAFAGAGATVALAARSEGPLRQLAAELDGTAHPVDLLDPAQVATLLHRVEDEAGPVDVLVNNAGMGETGAFLRATASGLDQTVRLNLTVPLELCRQAIPRMVRRGGGHLVNVGSLAALAYVPGMATYAATKAGLVHGSEAIRYELKGLPVGVTTVLVGGVPTDLLREGEEYAPFHQGFQRLRRTQLTPDTDPGVLAAAVVDAVRRGRKVVWLPRRAALFVGAAWLPRRTVERVLTGVPRRADPT
jgi:short-subunit dehydrogenase